MRDFRRYRVWQKGHQLTLQAYHVTKAFPKDERFGLTAQMRRAASSIPMNIAEGFGRRSGKDRARFVDIALGSTNEFQYQLILSKDLSYLEQDQHFAGGRRLEAGGWRLEARWRHRNGRALSLV